MQQQEEQQRCYNIIFPTDAVLLASLYAAMTWSLLQDDDVRTMPDAQWGFTGRWDK